jgi:hypothetical protein
VGQGFRTRHGRVMTGAAAAVKSCTKEISQTALEDEQYRRNPRTE